MILDIKPKLRTYLLTNTELTSLVGSRVYVDEVPQDGAFPYVFMRRQGSGILNADTLRDPARIQVICEAGTGEDAVKVMIAVDNMLHRKQNYKADDQVIRSSMRNAGPMETTSTYSGRPQQMAYYIVRY